LLCYEGGASHASTLNPIRRELVSIGVVVSILVIYLPFFDEPWSLYVALCTGYTMLVFGMLWSDGKWKRYIDFNKRTAQDLVRAMPAFLLFGGSLDLDL